MINFYLYSLDTPHPLPDVYTAWACRPQTQTKILRLNLGTCRTGCSYSSFILYSLVFISSQEKRSTDAFQKITAVQYYLAAAYR